MKKALVMLVLGVMVSMSGWGQGTFVRFYEPVLGTNIFSDILVLSNGNYLCIGYGQGNFTELPFYAIYSPTGQLVKEWQGSGQPIQIVSAVSPTIDGGFVLAGLDATTTHGSFLMVRFDSNADLLWSRRYEWSPGGARLNNAVDIISTPDGGNVLVGHSSYPQHQPANSQINILKVNAQGDSMWSHEWGGLDYDFASNVISTSDGGVLVSGTTDSIFQTSGVSVPILIKISGNGNIEWTKALHVEVFGRVRVLEKPNGEFLIAASLDGNGDYGLLMEISNIGDSLRFVIVGDQGTDIMDISPTFDGGYITTGRFTHWNGEMHLLIMKVDGQLNEEWSVMYKDTGLILQGLAVRQTIDTGYAIVGGWGPKAVLLKTDSLGNIPFTVVIGKVLRDSNANCIGDAGEIALQGIIVEATSRNKSYGLTDENGEYSIKIYETGPGTIQWYMPNGYWSIPSCQVPSFQVNLIPNDTLNLDIFIEPFIDCIDLNVTLNNPFLRRCFPTTYTVNYCNNGTLPANSPYLEIDLDPSLTVDSATIPWAGQTGNLYRFNLDTIGIGQCGSFNLYVTVDCDSTELGQTHCVSAHIYPDSICLPPDPAWDGSSVKVTGICDVGDTLDFKIENTGTGDMASPSFFLIAEDNVMYQSGNFQFLAGQDTTFRFKGNGSTFTLVAQQVEGHPGRSFPLISIEGCGTNAQGTFSKGFVTQYPQDDQDGFIDILCLENVGSYDPNDKRPEPLGLNSEGYINATQPLDYTVRFQNTGTDTAFTVVIRDTLSTHLDITTLRLHGASHAYTFQIIGSNVLEWTFPSILLPDSNTNEPLSHGFVSFHIEQADNNPVGTKITNRAGIYFDFSPPIITNTTLNTVIEDYKTLFTFIQSPESKLALSIFPNPSNGTFSLQFEPKGNASYEFAIYDLAGAKQFGQPLTGNAPFVLQPELPTGMYIYQLVENGTAVGMGKVVVNR